MPSHTATMTSPALGIDSTVSQITGAPRGSTCSAGLAEGLRAAVGINLTYFPSARSAAAQGGHQAQHRRGGHDGHRGAEGRAPTRVTSSYPSTCSSMCCPSIFGAFLCGALLHALGCARLLYTLGIFGASTGDTLDDFASMHFVAPLKVRGCTRRRTTKGALPAETSTTDHSGHPHQQWNRSSHAASHSCTTNSATPSMTSCTHGRAPKKSSLKCSESTLTAAPRLPRIPPSA